MSIYEAIGVAFVIFTSLLGTAVIIWVAVHGAQRLHGHLDIGRLDEDAAVRNHLDIRAQRERFVPR